LLAWVYPEMQRLRPPRDVSLNQIIECYRNANKLTHDPHFAYNAGLRFHFTDYGMYGFAMLSSTNYRQTMRFAMQYHQLAAPLAEIDLKAVEDARGKVPALANARAFSLTLDASGPTVFAREDVSA